MEKSSREIARGVRAASLKLRVLPTAKRTELLERLADLVEQRLKEILEANAIDVQNAQGVVCTKCNVHLCVILCRKHW